MNNSIKTISKILAILLKITSIAAIIYVIVFTIKDYKWLTSPKSYNDYEMLTFAFTFPLILISMVIRIIYGVIIVIEMIIKKRIRRVHKMELYEMDKRYKEKGVIGVILNVFVLGNLVFLAVFKSDDVFIEAMLSTFVLFIFIFVFFIYQRWLARQRNEDEKDDILVG